MGMTSSLYNIYRQICLTHQSNQNQDFLDILVRFIQIVKMKHLRQKQTQHGGKMKKPIEELEKNIILLRV